MAAINVMGRDTAGKDDIEPSDGVRIVEQTTVTNDSADLDAPDAGF